MLSIFDRHYKPGLTIEEGLNLADMCMRELQQRYLISQPDFVIKMIQKIDDKIEIKVVREAINQS